MPAVRKLDQASLDQIVAGRAAGQSFRKLAEVIEVDQSTLSRRVRSDPELQAAISAEKKRLARLARDRERKARAKARRAGTRPAPALEQEQGLAAGLDGGPPLEQADHARERLRASAQDDRAEDGSVDGALRRSRFRPGTKEYWLEEPRVRLVTESGKTAGSTSASNAERMRAALEPRHGPLRVVPA
jgi:hypothetical protein